MQWFGRMPHGKESQCVVGSDRRRLDEVILRGREKEEAEATRLKAATDAEANEGRESGYRGLEAAGRPSLRFGKP